VLLLALTSYMSYVKFITESDTIKKIYMFSFTSLKKRQINEYLIKLTTSSNLDEVNDKLKFNNVIS